MRTEHVILAVAEYSARAVYRRFYAVDVRHGIILLRPAREPRLRRVRHERDIDALAALFYRNAAVAPYNAHALFFEIVGGGGDLQQRRGRGRLGKSIAAKPGLIGLAREHYALRAGERRRGAQTFFVVVIAGKRYHRAPVLGERYHSAVEHALRFRRRNGRVEHVAGDEYNVDVAFGRRFRKLADNVALLVQPRRFAETFAEMQVGGM